MKIIAIIGIWILLVILIGLFNYGAHKGDPHDGEI